MKILIVDDEQYSVDGIASNIDWEALGITEIFKAYSMNQAQQIFENEFIDILLSDIEMPRGSGLDLIEWVREKKYPTVCMLLTCYSEFDYASRAIKLGILNYILKPVKYDELGDEIKKAAFKVQEQKENEIKQIHGEYWEEHRIIEVSNFLSDLTEETIPPEKGAILAEFEKRHINSASEAKKLLDEKQYMLLIRIIPDRNSEKWEKSLLEYAFRNIISELFSPIIAYKGRGRYLIVTDAGGFPSEASFIEHCTIALSSLRSVLPAEFMAYYDNPGYIIDAAELYRGLLDDSERNLSAVSTLFKHGSEYENVTPDVEIEKWREALLMRDAETILSDVDAILQKNENRIIDKKTLTLLMVSITNVICSALAVKNISQYDELFTMGYSYTENALNSVTDFKLWVNAVCEKAVSLLANSEDTNSIVDIVRKYVNSHIDSDINRRSIADEVHLNPDYLSYLFREKSGRSLSEFILKERIDAAKQLLISTDLPIHEIAIRTGFQSISYFSKQFKRIENRTPMQFRLKISG